MVASPRGVRGPWSLERTRDRVPGGADGLDADAGRASAWPSLWMQERVRQTGHRPTPREALFDFKLGYAGSLITAMMFLSLGALVMFGSGEPIAPKADDFAARSSRCTRMLWGHGAGR